MMTDAPNDGNGGLTMRYSVVLQWDGNEHSGAWVATVPAMDDAATEGDTIEEALEMARDLIEIRIAAHRDRDEAIPVEEVPVQLHQIEVIASDNPDATTHAFANSEQI